MRRPLLFMLSTASAVALLSGPALAQTPAPVETSPQEDEASPQSEPVNAEGEPVSEAAIVVTGSRIRRNTYTTVAPVDVVTRDDTVLAGASSTAETLQSTSITSGSAQVNNAFIGFLTSGGPAANTVGLRGLGPNRTLVLLNGRRLAPAGSTAETVVADLNVLPQAVVQRIEILREGASSIYGSDAISGVVNILTDPKFNGLTIDAYTNQPVDHGGGGRTYRLSLVGGTTLGGVDLVGSLEYRKFTELRLGDRKEFRCPRDLYTDPDTGQPAGQLTPDLSGERCFPYQYETIGIAQNYALAFRPNGSVNRFTYVNGDIGQIRNVNSFNIRPETPLSVLQDTLATPVETYTAYLAGTTELSALGDSELYAEALYTRRNSAQQSAIQLAVSEPQTGAFYYRPAQNQVNPFFPTVFANAGYSVLRPLIVPDGQRIHQDQQIDFFRSNAGLRGSLGFGDWKYDVNLMYSKNVGHYSVTGITIDRFAAALDPVLAPAGTPDNVVTIAQPGTVGAGGRYTCRINLTNGAYNGGSCIAADLVNPAALAGAVDQRLLDYLYDGYESRTEFSQLNAIAVIDGSLLKLPGGPLGFAIGLEWRRDKLRDEPSEAQQTGQLLSFSSSGLTRGTDSVREFFAEINAPILADLPFVDELTVAASARYTNYKSYGSDTVYRLNALWAPIEQIRFRGNYGTSFRAPNLFELNVADQIGFRQAGDDPCDQFVTTYDPAEPIYQNCLAEVGQFFNIDEDGDGVFDNWLATSGFSAITRGGAGILEAEKSRSFGLGVVLNAPQEFADLSLAIDYFNVKVKDSVTTLGLTILNLCYEGADFPNNQYCSFVSPREQTQGNLVQFLDPYINIALEHVKGIDFSGRYAREIGPGRLTLTGRATRMLRSYYQELPNEPGFDYVGSPANQQSVGGPKWVADVDARYATGPWTFRWGVQYVAPMSGYKELGEDPDNSFFDLRVGHYFNHSAAIQYEWRDVGQFTLGVRNVFNEDPPIIGSTPSGRYPRIGNFLNYSGYDFLGRSLFLNVTRSF